MVVSFTGTRLGCKTTQLHEVKKFLEELRGKVAAFHNGACHGADRELFYLCMDVMPQVPTFFHPSGSEQYDWALREAPVKSQVANIQPPLVRNRIMVDACDWLIACPGGREVLRSGTWSTVRYAIKSRKSHSIFHPDGSWEKWEC